MKSLSLMVRVTTVSAAVAALMMTSISLAQAATEAAAVASGPISPATPPDELVKRISTDVLNTLQSNSDLQQGDINKVIKLVDEKILPYTNFQRMTALAVGRAWREATPQQRDQLVAGFKQLLVRTYSGAVSQVRDTKLEFRPLRAAPGDSEVVVRSRVVQPSGEPIQLDYRLMKTPEGWKIYDVNVLGVWLVENYRNNFTAEINKNGIDGLIKALNTKNTESAKS